MTDEVRVIKYLDEALEFVKVAVLISKRVIITRTKDGYLVRAEDIKTEY